jgi:hypothetical protein
MNSTTEIKDMTAYALARLADCLDPQNSTSPGAIFLTNVRDMTVEMITDGDITERRVWEISDSAPDVYNYARMQEFADLGAWGEDITDYADASRDIIKDAGIALMIIAERLIRALLSSVDIEIEDN